MILLLKDRGYDVAVSSWTVAAKSDSPDRVVEVCYIWKPDSTTRNPVDYAWVTLRLTMAQFLVCLNEGKDLGFIDLRSFSLS
jgi:hypothetical protein